jgi:mono/diheme cytochrome c family protein
MSAINDVARPPKRRTPRSPLGRRRSTRRLTIAGLGAAGLAVGSFLAFKPARATNHELVLTELGAGVDGNAAAQFIEIRQAGGQTLWGPMNGPGSASAAMLVFFDQDNVETGSFRFPENPPDAPNQFVLVGTAAFRDLAAMPDPDVLIPAGLIRPGAGRVCFRNTPENLSFEINECVGYGGVGTNAVPDQLPTTGSLRRREATGENTFLGFSHLHDNSLDWFVSTNPTPIQADDTPPTPAELAEGRRLFAEETFGGNGRTCATCHVLDQNGGMPPSNVAARLATLADTFDPLFIAEPNMNLNTLTIASDASFPDGAILTGTGALGEPARAKVLARKDPGNPRVLLVHGGIAPRFAAGSTVSSGGVSSQVVSIVDGDLNGLEDPDRMNGGRALVLENIDGFGHPAGPVFRKSPHLQNLIQTGPFGFSSEILDLGDFSEGAVIQHFPRTLARRIAGDPGVTEADIRRPTPEERRLMKLFMQFSFESVPGTDPDRFNQEHFARTEAQRRGQQLFSDVQCTSCHNNTVLAGFSPFDTGVSNQDVNEGLPTEPPGQELSTRKFSTPMLFNIRANGPFFHDNSAATLEDAIRFYTTPFFASAADGFPIALDASQVTQVAAFLTSLAPRSYVVESGGADVTRAGTRVDFGLVAIHGGRASRSLVVRNTSSAPITFESPACRIGALDFQNPGDFPAPDCATLDGATLPPGGTRTITASFDPAGVGDFRSAILEILTTQPTGVDLIGNAEDGVEERFDVASGSPPPRFTLRRGGTFPVSGGQLQMNGCTGAGCVGFVGNLLTHDFDLPESFTLTVDGIATQTTSTVNDFVVIFNWQNDDNYYYASFNETDGTTSDDVNTNGIFRVVNGTRTQIRDFTPTTTPGSPTAALHAVRIEKMKGTIRVFRDGVLMGLVTDTSHTGGKAGVGSFNDSGRFDNFIVRRHLLSDDFSGANPIERIIGGTFSATGGKEQLTNPATGLTLPNSNIGLHVTPLDINSYEVFVDGNAPPTSSTFDDFTVFFGFQDENNHYFVNVSEGDDGAANGVFKVEFGVRTQIIGFGSNTTPPGTARRIRVQNLNGQIRAFRDDVQIGATTVDNSFFGGRVGVGSRNNAATFDNMFVERRP